MLHRAAVSVSAEPPFPVVLRVGVPAGGFGRQFDVIRAWLDQNVGRQAYQISSAAKDGSTALFLFAEASTARAFLDRFVCGIALMRGRQPQG